MSIFKHFLEHLKIKLIFLIITRGISIFGRGFKGINIKGFLSSGILQPFSEFSKFEIISLTPWNFP